MATTTTRSTRVSPVFRRRRRLPQSTSRISTTRTTTTRMSPSTLGVVAAVGLGALALVLFWPSSASAATNPPGPNPNPGPGTTPPIFPPVTNPNTGPGPVTIPPVIITNPNTPPVVIPRPGQELVTSGPARVAAPSGLNLRANPNVSAASIRVLPFGTQVNVIGTNPAGWLQVSTGTEVGWVCSTCPEGAETPDNIASRMVRPWIRAR